MARVWSVAPGGTGTYGLAYRAPALQTNGAHALTAMLRRSGGLVSNIGIENVGINDAGAPDAAPVTVRLTFYDPATGAIAGAQPTYTLAPGQVVQLNDATKQDALLFVDEIAGTAQIHGYTVLKDTATNDGGASSCRSNDPGEPADRPRCGLRLVHLHSYGAVPRSLRINSVL